MKRTKPKQISATFFKGNKIANHFFHASGFNNFIYSIFWYQGVSNIRNTIFLRKLLPLYYKSGKTAGLHRCLGRRLALPDLLNRGLGSFEVQ